MYENKPEFPGGNGGGGGGGTKNLLWWKYRYFLELHNGTSKLTHCKLECHAEKLMEWKFWAAVSIFQGILRGQLMENLPDIFSSLLSTV